MAELKIGSCSWKYPSWEGIVYSASKGIDYLAEYSKKYAIVEVDQWFWSLFKSDTPKLPDLKDAKKYRESVPDGFQFLLKVPNSITLTHHHKMTKSEVLTENPHFLSASLFKEFLKRIVPLKDCLGPLMFQFGYLNKQMMTSQKVFIEKFCKFLSEIPEDYVYAIEIRNPNYINPSYFEFLNSHQLGHVFIQGYWMPDIFTIYENFRNHIHNLNTAIIRLHGGDRAEIEKITGDKWDKIVLPKDQEISRIASMAFSLIEHGMNVYVNVNNHFEGSAPKTMERFIEQYKTI